MLNKKGISAIVATVLIILITVAAVTIVWAAVIPMIRTNLEMGTACLDADVIIDSGSGYTCYDAERRILAVQIKKGPNDVDIAEVDLLLASGGTSNQVSVPFDLGANDGKVFYLPVDEDVDEVSLAPVIQIGNSEKTCDVTAKVNLKSCSLRVGLNELILYEGDGILFDSFDTKDDLTWVYNSYQTVPFNDNGNNIIKNIATGTSYSANFYKRESSLSNNGLVQMEFKVDATDTVAHFGIEAWSASVYNRWAVIVTDKIFVQYTEGSGYQNPKTLINPIKIDTWYVVILEVDDDNQFYIKVYEKNNPDIFGDYSRAMPTGLNWRFHHWCYRNIAYIDNFFERNL